MGGERRHHDELAHATLTASSDSSISSTRQCPRVVVEVVEGGYYERPKSEHTDPAGCAKMQISGNRYRWYFQRGDRVARTVPARIRPAQSVATLEIVRRPRRWLFSDRDGQMHRHKPTPAPALRVLVTTPKTRNGSPAVCPCFAFFAHTGAFYRFFLQARAGRSMTLFRLFLLRPFRTRACVYSIKKCCNVVPRLVKSATRHCNIQ